MAISAQSNFGKYMALTAALLGWLFDGLEMGLFPITARAALLEMAVDDRTGSDLRELVSKGLQDTEKLIKEIEAGTKERPRTDPYERRRDLSKLLVDFDQAGWRERDGREVWAEMTADQVKLFDGLLAGIYLRWLGVITAFFLVGAATGGVLFGWLGDRIGRVRAMILSVLTYAIFSGLCGLASTPAQIGVIRFIAALGMGGEWSLGVALINEIWPGRSRAFLAGLIGAAANVGYLLIALVGWAVVQNIQNVQGTLYDLGLSEEWVIYLVDEKNKGWRLLMMFGAAPALLTLFIRIFVPESERWENERQRGATSHWANRDLLAVLVGAIAACGIISLYIVEGVPPEVQLIGTLVGLVIVTGGYLLPVIMYLRRAEQAKVSPFRGESESWRAGGVSPRSNPESDLQSKAQSDARNQGTLRLMLLAACLSGVALLGTWASVQQVPPWSGSLNDAPPDAGPKVQIWSSIGAIIGTILAALLADRFGRRLTYTMLCLGSLIIVPVIFLTNDTFNAQFLFFVLLGGAITASFYGWLPLYLPELFPTRVRATGQGFGFNFGRIIAAIGALQLANLKALFAPLEWSDKHILSVLACIYVVGMIIIWFAPETKGKPLPE